MAASEAAVRSHLIDGMPVTSTAMRVPGGDVVQRTAAVRDAKGRAVVLEFLNNAPVPVSLAVAVVPASASQSQPGSSARPPGANSTVRLRGEAGVRRAEVRGSQLIVDGRVAADLGRVPGGSAAVADGDVWRAVIAGPAARDCQSSSRRGLAAAAVVVPLTVGNPLRVTVPVEGGPVRSRPAEEVAAGWGAVVSRAASAALPDEQAEQAWRRGIAAAVLAVGGQSVAAAARSAIVLDRVGLADEADRGREVAVLAVERGTLSPIDAPVALRALASRRLRCGRTSLLADLAGPLVDTARGHLDTVTLEQAAAALEMEAAAAARDARRLLDEIRRGRPDPVRGAPPDLAAVLRDSAAFGGDGIGGIETLLDRLLDERPDRVVITPDLPSSWTGAGVDVRSLWTRHGQISFSLRWHGVRPALLWEREQAGDVPIGCGLDERWSSIDHSGEVLLEGTP